MNEKIEEVVNHPLFIPALVGLTGFASGLGLGVFLERRRWAKAEEIIETHEISSVEFEVEIQDDKTEPESSDRFTPVVIDEKVAKEKGIIKVDSLSDLSPSMVTDEPSEEEEIIDTVVTETVVEETTEEVPETEDGIPWDWDKELTERLSTAPYILHLEEFVANELGFTQYPLTFYAMDEILVDDQTVPIYNHSGVVGELKFGHGSGQEDVVYIRNHERKAEYEITRLDQSYAMEIHGLEAENNERIKDLRHGKLMKFRQD